MEFFSSISSEVEVAPSGGVSSLLYLARIRCLDANGSCGGPLIESLLFGALAFAVVVVTFAIQQIQVSLPTYPTRMRRRRSYLERDAKA